MPTSVSGSATAFGHPAPSGPPLVVVVVLCAPADRPVGDETPAAEEPVHLDIGLALRRLPGTALAPRTRRLYADALRRFESWLEGRPADDAMLKAYLDELSDGGLAPPSAALVVAAVARAALECARAGRACSEEPVGPATRERLERFRRDAAGRGRGQVRGVSWEEADRMCKLAEAPRDLRGRRDAAIVGVASDGLLRVSEVSGLDAGDVSFRPDGTARVLVRRSKTDQRGRGATVYVRGVTAGRLQAWMKAAGVGRGALFRAVDRAGRVAERRLGPDSVRAAIKRRAAAAGIGGRVSGHSLRVGSAQTLAEKGASLVELQTAGRWRSPSMPGLYVRGQEASRGAVARLRGGAAKKSKKTVAVPETVVVESG